MNEKQSDSSTKQISLESPKPLSYAEWSAILKDRWWTLNRRQFFSIKTKKKCYSCERIFTCESCLIEYWLCWRSTDWTNKTECQCADCLRKEFAKLEVKV